MWPAIIDIGSLLILFSSLIVVLFIMGYPLLHLFVEIVDVGRINPLQRLNYSLVLGMTALTLTSAWASSLGPFLVHVVVLLLVLGLFIIIKDLWKAKSNLQGMEFRKVIKYTPFLVVIIIVMAGAFGMVTGLAGSPNDDSAYHTLFTKSIVDNLQVVDRPLPNYNYLIYHPPGSHIVGAMIQIILAYPIEKVVVSLGACFVVLTILALYSLLKVLFRDEKLVAVGCILSLLSWNFWYPLSFTFTVQIAAFTIASIMAMILQMHRDGRGNWKKRLLILTMLLSFSAYVHPVVLVYVILWLLFLKLPRFMVLTKQWFLQRAGFLQNFKRLLLRLSLLAGFTVLLTLPYLKTVYTFLTNSTSGLPPDWIPPSERTVVSSELNFTLSLWDLLKVEYVLRIAASHGAFLFLAPMSIIFIAATPLLLLGSGRKRKNFFGNSRLLQEWMSLLRSALILLIYTSLIVVFVVYLSGITVPSLFGLPSFELGYVLDPVRSWELLYIPLLLLTCITLKFMAHSLYSIRNAISMRNSEVDLKRSTLSHKRKAGTHFFTKKTILLTIVLGLVFSQVAVSFQAQGGIYFGWPPGNYETTDIDLRDYSLLTADDLAMFGWIRSNTSRADVFLVSQADTGQYLTSVTGRKSVYPFGPPAASRNYRILNFALESDASNPYLLSLLRQYNVSYVFVGSKTYNIAAPAWNRSYWLEAIFDSQRLAQSPLFELTKRIGNTWIFKVRSEEVYSNLTDITLTVLPDVSMIRNSSDMIQWKVLLGTRSESELDNSVTVFFNSNLLILLDAENPVDFSNISHICLWAKSNGSIEYRLSLMDASNSSVFWAFRAYPQYSFFILDMDDFSGKSGGDISLENIMHIKIDALTSSGTSISIGPILLSRNILKINSVEHYDSRSNVSNWITELNGNNNYTIVIPWFLQLYYVEPVDTYVGVYPSWVIFLNGTKQTVTLAFRLASGDPRTLAIQYLMRPLRELSSYYTTTGSNTHISYDSSVVMLAKQSMKNEFATAQSEVILEARSVSIDEGEMILSLYIDGGFKGSQGAYVGIYRNYSDAVTHENSIAEYVIHDMRRWLTFESQLSNVSSIYLSIDNMDIIGEFYVSIQAYSFGIYY